MRKVAVLGSTGSIGTQTLDVAREQGDIEIVALSCGGNTKLMEEQMREFRPKLVSVWSEEDAKALRENTKDLDIPVLAGMDGLLEVATHPDSEILVTAIVGMLGIDWGYGFDPVPTEGKAKGGSQFHFVIGQQF